MSRCESSAFTEASPSFTLHKNVKPVKLGESTLVSQVCTMNQHVKVFLKLVKAVLMCFLLYQLILPKQSRVAFFPN